MTTAEKILLQRIIETYSSEDDLIPKYANFPYAFKMASSSSSPTYITDEDFDARCSKKIRSLSARHWTQAAIARSAAKFLVESPMTKVLDIGSGVGKFCIVGANYTNGSFTGVEQRKNLCKIANNIAQQYNLTNVKFIHANITQIDFNDYNAFYFYNSFHENIERAAAIDSSIDLNLSLYHLYTQHLIAQLAKMSKGTRLVTNAGDHKVPVTYELQYTDLLGKVKFWEKTK